MQTDATSWELHNLIASDRVEGTRVRSTDGAPIGTIERVMIDKLTGNIAYAVMRLEEPVGVAQEDLSLPGPASPTIRNLRPTDSISSTENLARCRPLRRIRISTGAAANAIGGLPKPGEFGASCRMTPSILSDLMTVL
jgi:hypothetical protein